MTKDSRYLVIHTVTPTGYGRIVRVLASRYDRAMAAHASCGCRSHGACIRAALDEAGAVLLAWHTSTSHWTITGRSSSALSEAMREVPITVDL